MTLRPPLVMDSGCRGSDSRRCTTCPMASRSSNTQKHENRNPVQRWLISRFHRQLVRLAESVEPSSIIEVGCGEGYVLDLLASSVMGTTLMGIELSGPAVAAARERLADRAKIEQRDARDMADVGTEFDLVVMVEVLEHIPQPETMLPLLSELSSAYVLLSVPWEPWFRGLNLLRGRHIRDLGNDPEHVNHWSRAGFLDFIAETFDVVDQGSVFPWTMVLASPRAPAAG